MRYFIFIVSLLVSYSSPAQITEEERVCIREENLAQKDWYNKEMKYYMFGLIPETDTMKIYVLHTFYNIELRNMGCVMDNGLICYNKKVEQIIKRRYKTDLWKAVEHKTDSLNKLRQPR